MTKPDMKPTPIQGPDFSNAEEADIIQFCTDEFKEMLGSIPDLEAYFDDVDLECCTRAELIAAFRKVPRENVTMRQVLRTLYAIRVSMSVVSGRSFY
jgi:hypothetical protein